MLNGMHAQENINLDTNKVHIFYANTIQKSQRQHTNDYKFLVHCLKNHPMFFFSIENKQMDGCAVTNALNNTH